MRAARREVGERAARRPRILRRRRQIRTDRVQPAGEVRRRRCRRLPVQRGDRRGVREVRSRHAGAEPAERHRRPVLRQPGQRRAAGAVAARLHHRRVDRRRRHDRARRGQRPRGHQDLGGARRGRLDPQRLQDIHLRGHQLRPGRGRGPHQPRRRPQGLLAAGRRARHGGLHPRPQARQDGSALPPTPPNCTSRTSGCRGRTCSARRARVSTT